MTSGFIHTSVLLPQSIESLQPGPGRRFIDATLGAGGHAEKILELSTPDGTLLGIDADPDALHAAGQRLARFGDRFVPAQVYFDEMIVIASAAGFVDVDGVLFDLGVSSPQLDRADRGFSFQQEAPLDMRFGPTAPASAAELVNELSQDRLESIFREYGEERYAGRVAQRIVRERSHGPISTTVQLAEIVKRAKPRAHREGIHPATRVFQALRIAVNDELGRLRRALPQALEVLRIGGRVVVISFHSLEDRIVKHFFRQEARGCICPPELPTCVCGRTPTVRIVTNRPVTASAAEVQANPRARSAKLRVAELIAHQEMPAHLDLIFDQGGLYDQ